MRNPSSASSSPEQRDVGLDDRVVSSLSKTKAMVALCSKLVGMKRGPWTPEEDELLSSYINREGHGRWRTLPKRASLLRCGKSCRLRWMNYLRPSVKHGHIAPDEEDLILRLLGNRWSLIAGRLPGRTDNEIKNYWNAHLSKKLIRQGIDPRTHKQLLSSSLDRNTITTAADPHNSITINNTNIDNQYVDSYSEHRSNNLNLSTVSTVDLYQVPTRENKDFQGYLGAMPLHNHKSRAKGKGHLSKEEDDASVDVEGDDNDAEEVKTYADDDVFSLFLSSVINYEELLKGVGGQQQQHDEHEPAGNIAMIPAVRSTSLQAFASSGTGWDAPTMHGFF